MAKATTAPKAGAKQQKADSGKLATGGAKTPAKQKSSPDFFLVRWYKAFVTYLKNVRTEMNRVVWPTRPDVINSSVVVLVTLLFFMVFTFGVDQIVVQFLRLVASLKGVVG